MTQLKILQRQPSIQNIQLKAEGINKTLSSCDINRLFKGPRLPKFQLIDIKDEHTFCKKEKAQFFIAKLQSWNRQIEEGEKDYLNSRTQFSFVQFMFSSLKRICMMGEHETDQQLQMLYKWYTVQIKKFGNSQNPIMPEKRNSNQYYQVTKTFKTNPTLLVDQYRRPKILFKPIAKKQNIKYNQTFSHSIQPKNMNNNFLTELHSNQTNFLSNKQNQKFGNAPENQIFKKLRIDKEAAKARQQQLRRYLQLKEMVQQQWNFKLKKGRLLSESTKDYYKGSFNTALRSIKSSQGPRQQLKQKLTQDIKKLRIQTSLGGRKTIGSKQNLANQIIIRELTEIGSTCLMSNPFQTKIKRKKKNKK